MNLETFVRLSGRTDLAETRTDHMNALHYALGLCTEYFEIKSMLDKSCSSKGLDKALIVLEHDGEGVFSYVKNKSIDLQNLNEELGDMLWYCARLIDVLDLNCYYSYSITDAYDFCNQANFDESLAPHVEGIADQIKKNVFYKDAIDVPELANGVFTLIAVIEQALSDLDLSLELCMRTNIAKLNARYPEKFTKDAALIRNLGLEKKILDEAVGK